MLCVTNWGAILEVKEHPRFYATQHWPLPEVCFEMYNDSVHVADPDAIDAGQVISLRDIRLIAIIKQ